MRRPPLIVFATGAAVLAASTAGLLAGREPFASWYYHFAWLGTLLMGDAVVAWTGSAGRRGRFFLLDDAAATASLFFWSAVLWLLFEAINLRIQNWYYVFLPRDTVVRWVGEFVAFGTVLPAVLVAEAVLNGAGFARGARWRRLRPSERRLRALPFVGCVLLALPLIWPTYFFPLIWVGLAPILEPFVYRRAPERSLLADLERGEPGRLLRLLVGGAAIGLLWEMFNIGARTKWIYTVPGFAEAPRIFEMPVLGFFGFPPFAVECFVAWQAIVVAGLVAGRATAAVVVVPPRGSDLAAAPAAQAATTATPEVGAARAGSAHAKARQRLSASAMIAAYGAALAGSLVVLAAMDGRTVDSLRPTMDLLTGMPPIAVERLSQAGYDPFRVANAEPAAIAAAIGDDAGSASTRPDDAGSDATSPTRGLDSSTVRYQAVVSRTGAAADSTSTGAVTGWIEAARLATFRGIGAERAMTLTRAGIASIPDLAGADPSAIMRALERGGDVVPAARVRVWVHAARRVEQPEQR